MFNIPGHEWLSGFKKLQQKISPDGNYQPEDGLNYWREQVFMRVITVIVVLAAFAVGLTAVLSTQVKYWAVLVMDLIAFSAAFFAAFSKKITLRVRMHIFMIIIYSLGLFLQIIGGAIGNGSIILFIFPVMAAVLLGLREAVIALVMNIIVMFALGIMLHFGMLENTGMAQYTLIDWIGTSTGLIFFDTLAAFSLSTLFEGLTDSFARAHQSQIAYQKSQKLYKAIIEDQIELVDRWKPDGTLIFVNQAVSDYSGIPREELIGKNFFSFLPEEQGDYLKEHLNTLTPNNPVITVEEVVNVRGRKRWMLWTNRALFDENDEIQEFQSVGRDITDRKRAEENLERSESRYRAIVETQNEIISRWRPDTSMTFINDAGCKFYNQPQEELLQTSIIDKAPEDEKQKLRDYIASFSPDNPSQTIQLSGSDKDGNIHWFEWHDNALIEKGRIVEFQSVGRDITVRKRVEEKLAYSEERYRAIIEDQIELLDRWKPDGTLTFANQAIADFAGMTREELVGRNIFDFYSLTGQQTIKSEISRLTPDNPFYSTDQKLEINDKVRWVRWVTRALFDSTGEAQEFQSVGRDITDHRKSSEELARSETRYRAVVEDQLELICRLQPDGTINFTNHAYARFFGNIPEELIGSKLTDLVDQEEADKLLLKFSQLSLQQPIALNTHLETNADGEKRWYQWTNRGIFDEEGNLLEIQAIGQDIHEKKLAEQALQESEARYRVVVEDQVELICRVLPNGLFTFVNNAYAHFYGKTPEELLGKNVAEILNHNLITKINDDHTNLTPDHPIATRINETTNAKGDIRWFTWTDRGIFDDEGNLQEIQGIGRDIHEQILAEQALQASETRYRAVVEDQIELICRLFPNGVYTFVNDAYARFHEKKPYDLVGHRLADFISPDRVKQIKSDYKKLKPDNPTLQRIIESTNAQGETRWFQWIDRGIFDEAGELQEIQGIGRDIHDRKLAEQALQESEARYRAIVQDQIEPVCRWRPDYTLTFVNDAYCHLFSKPREELLGQSIKMVVPEDDWIIIEQMVLDLKTGTSNAVDENRVITADGVRWLQWALSAIKAENGTVIEFQSVGHDVSEQKHTQQMLEKTLSDQIKLAKANSELAERLEGLYLTDVDRHEAQLGHLANELHDDVLNALAVVSTNLDPDETPKHVIRAYERAIQRTREIVNGLRTAMLNYGLYIGLETLADELADQLPEGPLIYVDVPHSIIRYDSNVELHLFRIVQEACNNAIKHANASEIHIQGELDTEKAYLEVVDNGTGFDAEDILDLPDLLREKHFGLAGMFERAELIHSELSIHSELHKGSRVRVVWDAEQA